MSKTYTVKVTADDIAKGCRTQGRDCPVYRALARALGREDFHVCSTWIENRSAAGFGGKLADLPGTVCAFINAFDWGLEMLPFTFTIIIP